MTRTASTVICASPSRTPSAGGFPRLAPSHVRLWPLEYVDQSVSAFAYVTNDGDKPLPRAAVAKAVSLGTFTLAHRERVRGVG